MMKWKQDIRVKVMITLTNPEADFTIYNYTLTAEKQVFDYSIAEMHVAKMIFVLSLFLTFTYYLPLERRNGSRQDPFFHNTKLFDIQCVYVFHCNGQ